MYVDELLNGRSLFSSLIRFIFVIVNLQYFIGKKRENVSQITHYTSTTSVHLIVVLNHSNLV